MAFRGFPPEAVSFYEKLEADNSKSFWQANKATYQEAVRQPMEDLAAEFDEEYGPFHLFRPHRDVRFSKDKTPYKTAQGMVGEREGGAVYYLQLSAAGLMVGSGYYAMASDQLDRFRRAVDDDHRGAELEGLIAPLTRAGFTMGAIDEVKTAPRGYRKDHPRIEIIRRKGLIASRSWPVAKWMHTKAAAKRVVDAWRACAPLNDWLDTHVGPSELPPPDAGRW